MKKIAIVILVALISVFLSGSYYETVDSNLDTINNSKISKTFSDETVSILDDLGIDEISIEAISEISFEKVWDGLKEMLVSNIKYPFYSLVSVIVAGMLCTVLQSIGENIGETKAVYNVVCTLAVSSIVIIPIKETVISVSKVIEECSNFMLSFIPVYSSALVTSGYISSAAGYRTLMLGTVTVISRVASNVITPFVCIYLAMSIADSVSSINLSQITKYIKDFTIWVLGAVMAAFSGIMGLGTIISSSADKIGSKTIKFVVGSAVPIVGSAISDILSTVKSCLILTKDVLGTYAIIVIAVIFISITIKIIMWKISLSIGGIVGDIFDNGSISNLFRAASAVMGIMLAIIVTVSVMMIFSVAILLLTVRV